MTLDQLRIFLAVARREHVTRAAEALHLTQSAVSSAISALESRHGMQLFERVGRGIRLTEAGRLFQAEAQAVLDRAAVAEQALADLADLRRGQLTLAASQTLASFWLPRLLVRFRAAHPGIHLTTRAGNSHEVVAEVEALRADLGFIEGGAGASHLIERVIGEDEMVLVVAPGHPWAGAPPDAGALSRGAFVMREPGSGTRAHMDAALAALGLAAPDSARVLELPSNEAVRQAVLAGGGASLLSRLVVGDDLIGGRLALVATAPVRRSFRLLRHPERHLSHAARAFLAGIPPA